MMKANRHIWFCFYFILLSFEGWTQSKPDSLTTPLQTKVADSTVVNGQNGELIIYKRSKPFSFITQIPKTLALSTKMTFSSKSIPVISSITASTLILVALDQHITDEAQQFARFINLDGTRSYGSSVGFKMGGNKITIYDIPKNLNSGIYSIGEGLTSVVLSGCLFTYGKIKRDYRMTQTASQIMQAQLTVGLITQTIKRISGRESPRVATAPGGVWRPFTHFSSYQDKTSHYDAFPSGHLATMMATVTVLALNYPEKKWIKPIGYSLITLVGFAMINNGVHWAGDYPLALGIGYVTAKATVKMNRWIQYKK